MYPSYTQANQPHYPSHLRFSSQATYREMDLNGTHQEDLHIAKSVISECQTMPVSIAIYFLAIIILLWNTLQISCLLILIVIIFLGKLTKIAKKKPSACIDHIALVAL
jgi:hypothetical protein